MDVKPLDFQEITKDLPTKSAKIRALGQAGASTTEIARYLGIRYQHARNVLADAKLRGGLPQTQAEQVVEIRREVAPSSGLGVWLKIGADGSVVLPARLLSQAELKPGGQVFARFKGDALELLSQRAALRRAHEIVSRYVPPGVSLADELIAERRAEARRELEGR